MKTPLVLALAASSAVAFAETYTVTTDSGTFDSPVAIVGLPVTAGVGEAATTITFAEMTQRLAPGDVLVKKGSGFVASSAGLAAMASSDSEIRVEEGAFVVSGASHLGGDTRATAPKVTVADGATLLLAGSEKFMVYNKFTFSGNGVTSDKERLGAFCAACSVSQQDTFFDNAITLEGDTDFYNKTGKRIDFYPGESDFALQGHRLTFRGTGTFCFSGVYVDPGETGGMVVDGMCLQLQGGSTAKMWGGSAANTLVITNGANMSVYNNNVRLPWTVIWNSTSSLNNSSASSFASFWGQRDRNCFDGPVRVDSRNLYLWGSNAAFPLGYAFGGPVSGVGGIYAQEVVHLWGENTFQGTLTASAPISGQDYRSAGVCLYRPEALPANGKPLTLVNAFARMADDQTFDVQAVEVRVDSDAVTNNYISGGAAGGTIGSLKKTGVSAFEYLTPMNVTGTVELAEGTLRLPPAKRQYSTAPGLWFGMTSTNRLGIVYQNNGEANAWANTYMAKVEPLFTDSVEPCPSLLYGSATYPPWEQYEIATWSGYIWNRSPTNEHWTFAMRMTGYMRLFTNDVNFAGIDDNQNVALHRVEMKPGPNRFVLKACPRGYDGPGAGRLVAKDGKSTAWPAGWGISVDRLGRANNGDFADIANYERLFNETNGTAIVGGNGELFTRDERDVTAFSEAELEAAARGNIRRFVRLVARPGTTFDLGAGNYHSYSLPELVGCTTVTNGSLSVVDSWTIPTSQVVAGGKLYVDGALEFGADAEIAIDEDVKPATEERKDYVVAEAKDGITMPENWEGGEIGRDDFKCRYRLRLSEDGKRLVLGIVPKGLMLFVR